MEAIHLQRQLLSMLVREKLAKRWSAAQYNVELKLCSVAVGCIASCTESETSCSGQVRQQNCQALACLMAALA